MEMRGEGVISIEDHVSNAEVVQPVEVDLRDGVDAQVR